MINHIHLIVQCPDVAGFIRSFKTHTSKELIKNIRRSEPTLIKLLLKSSCCHSVWEKTNMPKIVMRDKFFQQKKQYIEKNPVRRRYVELPEDWIYSSAHSPCLINIDEP
jgi:putative transposase